MPTLMLGMHATIFDAVVSKSLCRADKLCRFPAYLQSWSPNPPSNSSFIVIGVSAEYCKQIESISSATPTDLLNEDRGTVLSPGV